MPGLFIMTSLHLRDTILVYESHDTGAAQLLANKYGAPIW